MAHTFLMEEGRWILQGHWLENNTLPIPVKGKTIVAWNQENWFTWVTKLVFPGSDRDEIAFQYRGRFNAGERQYNFVLQQSLLGRVEGEGWIAPESIIQRYWVLGDTQRGDYQQRSGFETLYRLDDDTYYLSSGILTGHHLTSIMEATLERQN
ncbi:hypothetical protein IQ249_13485 [Lusitaniella coriacea LEGE 07157]|uniref:Uncharacterized protein n=1 Tax=Lusitaniella coriacea LEGE 07157 TaxID=945747 RepID=A0A8J7J3F3_9CYAN|nr:hypothetical protein [Lusitaniella coriacea]MBE9116914.1 hypothetical protein [Lusitaniella coriacea LEGE 07157]